MAAAALTHDEATLHQILRDSRQPFEQLCSPSLPLVWINSKQLTGSPVEGLSSRKGLLTRSPSPRCMGHRAQLCAGHLTAAGWLPRCLALRRPAWGGGCVGCLATLCLQSGSKTGAGSGTRLSNLNTYPCNSLPPPRLRRRLKAPQPSQNTLQRRRRCSDT